MIILQNMATIMIENVPEKVAQRIGNVVTFTQVRVAKRRNFGKLAQALSDPNNTLYWPMSSEDFISEMKKW